MYILQPGIVLKTVLVWQTAHYENMTIQIYWKFYLQNIKKSDKNSNVFHISAQNIYCWYSLEPPQRDVFNEYPSMFLSRNKKIMYTSVNPNFTI